MSLAADAAAVILAARMAARVLQFFAGLLERTKSGLRERINMVVEELLQKNCREGQPDKCCGSAQSGVASEAKAGR